MATMNPKDLFSTMRARRWLVVAVGGLVLTAGAVAALVRYGLGSRSDQVAEGEKSIQASPSVGVPETGDRTPPVEAGGGGRSVEGASPADSATGSLRPQAGMGGQGGRSAGLTAPPGTPMGRMVEIPTGTFKMGSNEGFYSHKPEHKVTLARFEMDDTEVTLAAYRACVRGGACSPAAGESCNWAVAAREEHPINFYLWIPGDTCFHTHCEAKLSLSKDCRRSEDDSCVFGQFMMMTDTSDLDPRKRRAVSLHRNITAHVYKNSDYPGGKVLAWSYRPGKATLAVTLLSGHEAYLVTLANALIDSINP